MALMSDVPTPILTAQLQALQAQVKALAATAGLTESPEEPVYPQPVGLPEAITYWRILGDNIEALQRNASLMKSLERQAAATSMAEVRSELGGEIMGYLGERDHILEIIARHGWEVAKPAPAADGVDVPAARQTGRRETRPAQ